MKSDLKHYEFVNSQTGNVIAYLSLPLEMDEKTKTGELEKKRTELAYANQIFYELIFWRTK